MTPAHTPLRARAGAWAYILLPLLLLPLMLWLSRDFGFTWDEKTQQLYGERVWRFLLEGQDDDWFRPAENQFIYLYGGLFDTLCVGLQQLLPSEGWSTRHYVNAAFGWLGIVYVGRIGRLLGGTWTGLLAMALLALSPRYLADSMNNPKDLPLAALLAVALFYLLRVEPRHPYLGWRRALPLVLAIALAVNVRAGALVFLAYLAVLLVALTLAARERSPLRILATTARFAAAAVLVLLLGTVFWPWAQLRPLKRPWQAIARLSQFDWNYTVLFDGRDVPATALPWDYVPRWWLITTPPVVTVGAALSLLVLWHLPRRGPGDDATSRTRAFRVLGLWAVALAPVVYATARGATLYDGIRHFLFTYPPVVVLAACGWRVALGAERSRLRWLAGAALTLGLVEPLVFEWRNHPNEGVYFNALVGGPRGALGRYELDYWGNSLRQGVAWADAAARAAGTRLVVSGRPHHLVRDDAQLYAALDFTREEDGAHQLEVLVLRGPRQDVLDLASRTDILHAVTTADGTPLAVVVPGPRYAEVEGRLELVPKQQPAAAPRPGSPR